MLELYKSLYTVLSARATTQIFKKFIWSFIKFIWSFIKFSWSFINFYIYQQVTHKGTSPKQTRSIRATKRFLRELRLHLVEASDKVLVYKYLHFAIGNSQRNILWTCRAQTNINARKRLRRYKFLLLAIVNSLRDVSPSNSIL